MPKRRRIRGSFTPRRLKERDGLIPAAGVLICDLSTLSKELEKMAVCSKCRKGTLQLKMDALRMGFASKLVIQCSNV